MRCGLVAATRHRTVKLFASEQMFFCRKSLGHTKRPGAVLFATYKEVGALEVVRAWTPERTALRARIWAARSRNVLVMQRFDRPGFSLD